jgi:hypothetical protein
MAALFNADATFYLHRARPSALTSELPTGIVIYTSVGYLHRLLSKKENFCPGAFFRGRVDSRILGKQHSKQSPLAGRGLGIDGYFS